MCAAKNVHCHRDASVRGYEINVARSGVDTRKKDHGIFADQTLDLRKRFIDCRVRRFQPTIT